MAFKTFAPGVLTSSDVNTFLMRQAVIVCTSSTRPASPSEGMTIYETDTDRYATYNGSAWVANNYPDGFRSYTPTLTDITLGNGTLTAVWTRVGAHVTVHLRLLFGSTTAITGSTPGFSGPFEPKSTPAPLIRQEGLCALFDASTVNTYVGTVGHGAVNIFYPQVSFIPTGQQYLRDDFLTAAIPMTWGVDDVILATWSYEANTP
jgi:hypothetical protein